MPGKRTRKDSDRSSSSSNGLPGPAEISQHKGAGSSSSGSLGDESENTSMRLCCLPGGCQFGEGALSPESAMIKVICNYEACSMSEFMHRDCFNHWEEGILNFLRSHGRARSWSEKQRRQNLWTKKGYDLAYRACLCKCKRGHLRKDLDWIPQDFMSCSENEPSLGKKKNRRRHKDLPSLGSFNGMVRTKSKPIPNNKDNRNRHSSTNSNVSVDQGYLSASPVTTCDMGSSFFSPPFYLQHKATFSFPHSHSQSFRGSTFHAPSTSPLPEMPDDFEPVTPDLTPSPISTDTSPTSPLGVFTPPLSPEANLNFKQGGHDVGTSHMNESHRMFPKPSEQRHEDVLADIQSMSALIDNIQRHRSADSCQAFFDSQPEAPSANGQQVTQALPLEQAFSQLCFEQAQAPQVDPYPTNGSVFPQVPFNSPTAAMNHLEQYQQDQALRNALISNAKQQQANALAVQQERRNFNSNAQVLLALRQKEQKEMEKRELNKFILSMMSAEENKTQVLSFPPDKPRHHRHTEIRLVPMKSTKFAKRYDFSHFENVLPRQHINPYRIKMEGEGYGSDDLRNFILASLSKANCSQMNCVLCGVDLPVYNHFPLIDGTMFLSPEKNEKSTKYCFKIKVEGKCEYVHAACIRCLEGLHNIVCRLCNGRWEGMHLQLGTLYMYDIFAASPCCQQRLSCKQCGGAVIDIRQGLTYFSDYSSQKACPHCHAMDHHFVRPATTYQLMGLVFS